MSDPPQVVCGRCGEVHDPAKCSAHVKLDGGLLRPCRLRPVHGTTVCHKHGAGKGSRVQVKASRTVERRRAEADLAAMGHPVDTTPVEALEQLLCEAAGNVAFLRMLVIDLGVDVYGETFHATGRATGEAKPNVLVVMYGEERDRLARIAKDCAALGLDERRVRLAEAQINRLFEAVTVALEVLPVSQREAVRGALVSELRRGAGGPSRLGDPDTALA